MFTHRGPDRSLRKNAALAGYLAVVAGFVNSGGFVLLGTFTSHVTGNVGRLSVDLSTGGVGAALSALLLVATFFGGAFCASLIIEAEAATHRARGYGIALLVEGLLLGAFISVAGLSRATHPRVLDAEAAILCLAMGMQNSLVTQLSGAVIRTTHLTGIVTDLGIEAARWYRWHRRRIGRQATAGVERPSGTRSILLLVIVGSFIGGAVLGALVTYRASRWSMVAPALAIVAASIYAMVTGATETRPLRSAATSSTTVASDLPGEG